MRHSCFGVVAIVAAILCVCSIAPAATTTSISQYDITWTFSQPVEYGQFATGDYWVIGPVSITSISPLSEVLIGTTTTSGFTLGGADPQPRTMNGSMVNPVPPEGGGTQGFDSDMYIWHPIEGRIYSANYDASLNVAIGVDASNPLVLQPGSSLVSTKSIEAGSIPQLKSAAILTVLGSIPPNNGATCFRPPYSGSAKPIYSTTTLRKDLLPNYPLVANVPLISEVLAEIHRPWLDHYAHIGNGAKYSAPLDNQPAYGTEYALVVGRVATMLMLDEASLVSQQGQNKDQMLIHFVQKGIDLYYITENGGYWWGRGGLDHGRKWPIMFAGLMLDNAHMASIGSRSKDMPFWGFSEDSQTSFMTQYHVDLTNGPLWDPDERATEFIPVSTSDIGMAEWCEGGFAPGLAGPDNLNLAFSATYRAMNSPTYPGLVLPAMMMGQRDAWNHEPLFEYTDRFVPWALQELANESEFSKAVNTFGSLFMRDMWQTYRAGIYYNYPPLVDAGSDLQITFPTNSVALDATVSDDGEPDPPAAITASWSKLSGLGTVTFGDASSVDTTASFSHYGVYELQLQVTDGDKTASDTVVVTVNPQPGTELVADAGADQAVVDSDESGSETVQLDGSGSDAPVSTIVSYVWSEDGSQIATGVSPSVSLSVGLHTITLTVTDSDGYVDTDSVDITVFLPLIPGTEQLVNGDFEDIWGDVNTLGSDITLPVTVDSSLSSDWETIMVGDWARQAAGNWNTTPAGTGNDSDYAPSLRKTYGTAQALAKNAVSAGTTISLNWDYHVPTGLSSDTVFTVRMIGVNEAAGGEAATQINDFSTTINNSSTVSGETGNFDEFFNMELVISPADPDNGTWQSATQQQILVDDSWDYIVVIFGRSAGAANLATIQMDNVSVVISSQPNVSPVADAGSDQNITDTDANGYENVTLDGSGSTDSDGTISSYIWTEGATQIATGVNPTVSLATGTHNITLTVTDNDSATDTDTVVVEITTPNQPPVADAGSDQSVIDADESGSEQVQLDGSGSSDSDGTIVSYVWSEGGSQIATGASPTVSLGIGTHTITLEVTDNTSLTGTDTVEVTVISGANLLAVGDFETTWVDHTTLGSDVTFPLTVDSSVSSIWETVMIGDWVRQEAGNWHETPAGSGNDSDFVAALRKTYGTAQSLPLGEVVSGCALQLDWDYHVPTSLALDTTFSFRLFGVNEAISGQSDTVFSNFSTTPNDSSTVTGESVNFQEIFNTELTVIATDPNNGTWQSASPSQISITDNWDYLVLIFGRSGGVANIADIQVDNISLTTSTPAEQIIVTGDINGDGVVDIYDFLILRSNYGSTGALYEMGDLNRDGTVNMSDFLILRANYGK